jgi:hypothetical protein
MKIVDLQFASAFCTLFPRNFQLYPQIMRFYAVRAEVSIFFNQFQYRCENWHIQLWFPLCLINYTPNMAACDGADL